MKKTIFRSNVETQRCHYPDTPGKLGRHINSQAHLKEQDPFGHNHRKDRSLKS